MSEGPSNGTCCAGGERGLVSRLRRVAGRIAQPDPNRLKTPAGERIVDIYRRAYVEGGLSLAQAREVHAIWHRESLRSLPSLLMLLLPAGLLVAIDAAGLTEVPVQLWAALAYATVANVSLVVLWNNNIAPVLHARGLPAWQRTLLGFAVVTLIGVLGYIAAQRLFPLHFAGVGAFLPVYLPFQMLLFWVIFAGFDVHFDYALVTRRWTDTPLQRLLPYDKRGKLVFLRASDHYVIVRTTKGEHELRMRFSDALERLGNARGVQVHRSFWVAQDYLAAPRKEGRRMVMRVDGVVIPISATYRDAVVRHLDLSAQA